MLLMQPPCCIIIVSDKTTHTILWCRSGWVQWVLLTEYWVLYSYSGMSTDYEYEDWDLKSEITSTCTHVLNCDPYCGEIYPVLSKGYRKFRIPFNQSIRTDWWERRVWDGPFQAFRRCYHAFHVLRTWYSGSKRAKTRLTWSCWPRHHAHRGRQL